MTCSACGAENRPEARFCLNCGEGLAQVCPNGHPVPGGAKFCDVCGAAIGAAPAPPAEPAAPAAERRLVSVLFADLVGFTTLSENRDAEETRELLSRYFETCRRLIGLYGGTVEKFIGDAVMAVWGTPVATEDDAERAVRAAVDLVAAVTALGDEVGAPNLRARAGVLTGEAAVTVGAEGEGMVAGDLVNTASRIQSVADPGAVLVGEATRRATEQAVVYEEAGSFELKGKEGLTPLWKALRIVSGARGSLKSHGLEAPFVGRDRELRQIKDLFHASAEEGKAHLVSITGIAGIGKSRLGWEFYKYVDGLSQVTYWHRGRCLAYGEGVTYWALADMVRMRCRIVEDEEPASALEKLQAILEEHVADPDERRFVEPRVAQLLGLGDQEARDKQDLFAAWRLFFERLADVYPTVLAFEDMQWADASLLDFVEYLLEWSRNSRLYVVTLARPELLERRQSWGAGHRNFSSLYLEPLSASAMEQLLGGLVPGLPAGVRDQILARAEGVPLYAVETVRMLLDRGLLVQEGPVYRPVGEIGSLEVPETLHALIAARLDGLSVEERRLLQDGAVLGKTFSRAGLSALAGGTEEGLEPLLAALVRKEVLGVQADPRSPEHGQYGFLQDLVRHVAYETISKRERRTRHLAAAAHLTDAFAGEEDEMVEVVASHYVAAYEAAPDAEDAGEIKGKARQMLARAGERAASLGASAEAQRYFEQAAGLADDPLVEAGLREQAGLAAFHAGVPEAIDVLDRGRALFEEAGETHAAARVAARLGVSLWVNGRIEEGIARLEESFAVLADEPPDADIALLAAELGRLFFFGGEYVRAAERIEFALEAAESLALPEVLSQALNTKGMILSARGRPEEGLALLRHALALALEHDIGTAAVRAYVNLSFRLHERLHWDEARTVIEAGLELARTRGYRGTGWTLTQNLADLLHQVGEWDECLRLVEELPEAQRLGAMSAAMRVLGNRGRLEEARAMLAPYAGAAESGDVQARSNYLFAETILLRVEGDIHGAYARATETLALLDDVGLGGAALADAVIETAEAALALGDLDEAERLLDPERLAPTRVSSLLLAYSARVNALLAVRRGETEAAESGFRRAAALHRELRTPFWLAVTLTQHAELIGGPQAARFRDEAREIFERIGATPWLDRVAARVEVAAG
jgi:class 3 adenylate cyclase/tetratricopeptide (TPR) repeat protein